MATSFPTNISQTAATGSSDSLEVYLLGTLDFDAALFLQERLVYEISGRDDRQGALLLCEHPPVVTVGRGGSRAHFRRDPAEFATQGLNVRWLNRGGGCLVHGPGQLAVYPILPLARLQLHLDEYLHRLEESLIGAVKPLHVAAERRIGRRGVWSPAGQFGFVGAAVKRWVSYHGLFVNVDPSLRLMRLVDPSGTNEWVTSLAAERVRRTSMHAVREGMVTNLAERLGYASVHVYTGHPLLARTVRRVHVYA